METYTKTFLFALLFITSFISLISAAPAQAAYHFSDFTAKPPIHLFATTGKTPKGVTPTEIKKLYKLPATGGKGTIVIIGAYNDTAMGKKDLQDFDATFNLPACTTKNGCFKRHLLDINGIATTSTASTTNTNWELETALDVEWAHAIAPSAKLLLVEGATASGANLLKAVDYAAKQKNVAAISMSGAVQNFRKKPLWIRILRVLQARRSLHHQAITVREFRGQQRHQTLLVLAVRRYCLLAQAHLQKRLHGREAVEA